MVVLETGRGITRIFFKASAEGGQVVKARLESNVGYRNVCKEKLFGNHDPFGAKIIIECRIGVLLKKS